MAFSPNPTDSLTFELLVAARKDASYPVTIIQSPAGEVSDSCRLDLKNAELRDALLHLSDATADANARNEVGAYLYDELFAGKVGALFTSSLNIARSQGNRLCIRLRFETPELAALPWELLYDANEASFLALSAQTALVRAMPLRLPVRPIAVEPPLRLLLVIANPHDAPQLDVVQEKEIIRAALAESEREGLIHVTVVEQATVTMISEAIRSVRPHIFHFVGHGLFDHDRATLLLENPGGSAHAIDEQIFREFFTGSQELRLAVLNACQSATLSSSQPLAGLAPQILQRQLSAVVAMQFPITDQAAQIFAREFYHSLALGYPVDAAISEARKGI